MELDIKIGCNGIVVKEGKLLLGLRKNLFGDGTYGLPGGHLEQGERLEEAMIKKLKAEIGVTVEKSKFASIIDQADQDPHRLQINFIVTKFSGKVKTMDPEFCAGWEWFDLDSLPNNIFPPHAPIIEAYINKNNYV